MTQIIDWEKLGGRLRERPQDPETLEHAVWAIRGDGLDEEQLGRLSTLAEEQQRPEHHFVLAEALHRMGRFEPALRVLLEARKELESRTALNRLGARFGPRIQDRIRFYQCQLVFSFTGKDVVEIGARLPREFVRGVQPASWAAVDPRGRSHTVQGFFATLPGGDPLLPLAGASADLVFSSSLFERLPDLEAALAEIFRVLRPEGRLYAEFSPLWSSASGHHLTGAPRELLRAAGLWPLEPWAHLTYSRGRMRDHLGAALDAEQVKLIERWLYRRPTLSRLFYEDYVSIFHRSAFRVERLERLDGRRPDEEVLKVLRRRHQGRDAFQVRGLRVKLRKPERRAEPVWDALEAPDLEEEIEARDAVREYLGASPLEVGRFPHAEGRRVFLVRLAGREVVLKVFHSEMARAIGCNFAADVFRRRGVPTPRLHAADPTGRYFGKPFVIQARARGVPFDRWVLDARPDDATRHAVLAQLGAHLRALHEHSWEGGFGLLNDRGFARSPTWADYLLERVFPLVSGKKVKLLDVDAIVVGGYLSVDEGEAIRELFADAGEKIALARPHLLHNDLTLKHVFVDPRRQRIEAIIDLNNAVAGDPAMELARFEYFTRGSDVLDAMLAGYGERGARFVARQKLYLLYVLIEKLHWVQGREEAFPGRRETDLENLRQVLGELRAGG